MTDKITEQDVRSEYVGFWDYYHDEEYDEDYLEPRGRDFDEWLRSVRAEAWDEAILFFEECFYGESTDAVDYNPYREGNESD